jgi:hypothetical protein
MAGYASAAFSYSLAFSGFLGGIVVGIACLVAASGFLIFAKVLAISVIGAAIIHLFGVWLPICRADQAKKQKKSD